MHAILIVSLHFILVHFYSFLCENIRMSVYCMPDSIYMFDSEAIAVNKMLVLLALVVILGRILGRYKANYSKSSYLQWKLRLQRWYPEGLSACIGDLIWFSMLQKTPGSKFSCPFKDSREKCSRSKEWM